MASLLVSQPKTTAYNGPPRDTVWGGEFIRCDNGHNEANISRGYDPRKSDYYLEAYCTHPGCGLRFKRYDKERRNEL